MVQNLLLYRQNQELEAGYTHVKIGRTFSLEEIVEAHRVMEENRAQGKLVVVLD